MKYSTLASPRLVLCTVLAPTVALTIPIIMCVFSNNISSLFYVVTIHLFMNLIYFLIYQRAFVLATYSQSGIKNKYLNLSYDDIQYATIIDVELCKYSLIPTIHCEMICFSATKRESSFWTCSKNECILLPHTPKVLCRLKECAGGKDRQWLTDLTRSTVQHKGNTQT